MIVTSMFCLVFLLLSASVSELKYVFSLVNATKCNIRFVFQGLPGPNRAWLFFVYVATPRPYFRYME